MPTYIRVKDLPNAATSPAADDFILLSGTANGARKISRSDFIAAIASQIVAAPSTYKIATLDGADKLTSSQDPSQSVSYLGGHDVVANSPALADGSGTAGDTYYVTNPGTRNYGSGNITAQEGDALVYSGSVWQLVEGIANILDGISTASTARTTLEVNSIDEDAQANGTKVTAPALYLNGTSSYVTVADDDKLSFTDGTDDLPFSISAFIKMTDATLFSIVGKYTGTSSEREWLFWVNGSDKLNFFVQDNASGNSEGQQSTAALTSYEGQWIHVAATYGGSGPNSASAFTAASDEITIFVNGAAVAMTDVSGGTYTGMANGGGAMWVGRASSSYAKGSIRDVKIFNRELTSTEIAQLARGNDLGFADEWAGTNGGQYTSDFSSTTDSFTTSATAVAQISGTIDGRSNLLRIAGDGTTANHAAIRNVSATVGKRYRIVIDYNIQASNTVVDGIKVRWNNGSVYSSLGTSAGAWGRLEFEEVATDTDLEIYLFEGASQTNAAPGTDYVYISSVTVTEIGTLADFRAEQYDTSTNKLYDLSDNAFVGTGTSVTLTGREQPVYETGTWTPTITFGSGSTGITYSAQEGYYTRIGDVVHLEGNITLTATGTDTGTAKIEGLPFTARNTTDSGSTLVMGRASNMASLTSAFNGLINNNTTNATLYDWGAAGSTGLTEANFTATTQIRFSGTYQIQ